MRISCADFEKEFDQYREHLRKEIHCLIDSVSVLRQISDHTHDYLNEINLAPGFFRVTEAALFSTVIMWADKLLDEKGQRGLFNFLTFVEYNRVWLSTKELQRRRSYADDHWMLKDRKQITSNSINEDRQKLRSLAVLPSIKLRRDKYHGHFDKKYFDDRSLIRVEAEIIWGDIETAVDAMSSILNNYSSDFDGSFFSWNAPNDLRRLLDFARRGSEKTD
ncbi:hypothetical protein RF679_06095 [Undibacterium cyanobacteriorum]|uniref:HEPN AbiU2-like domain-containing protein n=1 Tax=Undibacterium cyanobacteriorum TaxID=3073561 RepID=A0ABY9RN52_9BURK|nr:hypothetical protein [Undibacterium sp. 20NA77.5]WMW81852.1 hypothetical protein RF679_06095 [Undibacterium sp. 20NA77.5]